MIVYLFKFDRNTAENGAVEPLYQFLLEQANKHAANRFNYLPSKERVAIGVQEPIYKELCEWIKANVTYNFEFEEHSNEERCITQFFPDHKSFAVQYLFPFFTPESYLELLS
jgi:hypothetical protein